MITSHFFKMYCNDLVILLYPHRNCKRIKEGAEEVCLLFIYFSSI